MINISRPKGTKKEWQQNKKSIQAKLDTDKWANELAPKARKILEELMLSPDSSAVVRKGAAEIVINRIDSKDNCTLSFSLAPEYQKYIFAKGFISINGISLTLGVDVDGGFSVHLIPETLSRTNLQHVLVGDKVNIEFDQQTMTIVQTLERMNLR